MSSSKFRLLIRTHPPSVSNEKSHCGYSTVEVRPRWFSHPTALSSGSPKLPTVPWDQMFEDNKFWIPLVTEGKYFIGRIDFGAPSPGEDVGPLLRYWFATV